jgi:hypothetical protein
MDYYFEAGAAKLRDSMAEYEFRNVLSYVLSKIRCGHTSVRASRQASRYVGRNNVYFPLNIKAWNDTVAVTSNLSRRDSIITRGAVIHSIDGRPMQTIVDSFFQHLSADGYNTTHKYQTISNTGVFRNMYASIYGLKLRTPVAFTDTLGQLRSANIMLVSGVPPARRLPRADRQQQKQSALLSMRNMHIDTALHTAFMEVNSFSKGNRLRGFFRRSFRQLRRQHVSNLVVDMRGNGGGSVTLSNLMTRYLADAPFKIADSLYAIRNRSPYGKYQDNYFLYRLLYLFMVHKKNDGLYHFRYFEGRYFQPKTRNHFQGQTYILTGGNTFSAAALFTHALRNQDDVLVVGEETGGGAYGNTAWLIPDITLPHTHVRFRLPLFRLVIDRDDVKGRGIFPETRVVPTLPDIKRNSDYKMDAVIELIKKGQ